jgi:hypothetical protein
MKEAQSENLSVEEVLWTLTPDWTCPHCKSVNLAIRERCRSCGYDSNVGEFPWYDPLPPYEGLL